MGVRSLVFLTSAIALGIIVSTFTSRLVQLTNIQSSIESKPDVITNIRAYSQSDWVNLSRAHKDSQNLKSSHQLSHKPGRLGHGIKLVHDSQLSVHRDQ
ncbi:hypothetical protein L873DRAFT_1815595 [Choiromyces venosus 120613-1]|uniref:Uncharacterized protein n=1 Tax=Choiromyces venosus 120613-1 TaxID=1336337 RepID=A0A3N4JB14_9PEZI|nr:hypothetical protein L873DRAFT_1815595 [Choiromyces venosus 120613-1]